MLKSSSLREGLYDALKSSGKSLDNDSWLKHGTFPGCWNWTCQQDDWADRVKKVNLNWSAEELFVNFCVHFLSVPQIVSAHQTAGEFSYGSHWWALLHVILWGRVSLTSWFLQGENKLHILCSELRLLPTQFPVVLWERAWPITGMIPWETQNYKFPWACSKSYQNLLKTYGSVWQ